MEPQQPDAGRPKQTIQPLSRDLESTTIHTVEAPPSLYPTASNDLSGTLVEDTAPVATPPAEEPVARPHIRRIFAGLLLLIICGIVGMYIFMRTQ